MFSVHFMGKHEINDWHIGDKIYVPFYRAQQRVNSTRPCRKKAVAYKPQIYVAWQCLWMGNADHVRNQLYVFGV